MFVGCAGSDGSNGAAGAAGTNGTNGTNGTDLTAKATPESCSICHNGDIIRTGTTHQAIYNDYVDTTLAITIDSVTSAVSPTSGYDVTMLFTIKQNGAPLAADTLSTFEQKTYRAELYSSATRSFGGPTYTDVFTFGTPVWQGSGQYKTTKTQATFDVPNTNAFVYVYIAKGKLATEGMTLYADVFNVGQTFGDADTYVSTANVSGCEKCHGEPYRKHGYRAAAVLGLPDFAACKVCHVTEQAGGHEAWQLLVDDTARYAELNAQAVSSPSTTDSADSLMTAAENAKYAYKRNVMNDVHMTHAMEFAYPQSMANCATCHDGKLNLILTDANFNLTTCRSCHPVTAAAGTDAKKAPALITLMTDTSLSYTHGGLVGGLYADGSNPTCNTAGLCHSAGSSMGAPVFGDIHTGYDSMIYNASGTKYADAITASIDSATLTGNVLDIKFSVDDTLSTGWTVTPTVMVSFYGYNTKDFLLSCHTSDSNSKRMEKTIGTANTLFTEVPTGVANTWEVTLDLASYASITYNIPARIADGTFKRLEIGVMPAMKNPAGQTLGLNAPSRTFDIATGNLAAAAGSSIVDENKCNKCHDQLATTFHSGNRGGNVVVCRMCHVPTSGGSHLEMQSRSIDSYVHAVHSFQPFDPGDIDFSDPVLELRYEHHIESTFPNFTILNCEACHYPGKYNVPDQSKSMPGILSASDYIVTRAIGTVPSVVTGPAARACGACHRTQFINEDDAAGLAAFNEHTSVNGYRLEATPGVIDTVIKTIMSLFE